MKFHLLGHWHWQSSIICSTEVSSCQLQKQVQIAKFIYPNSRNISPKCKLYLHGIGSSAAELNHLLSRGQLLSVGSAFCKDAHLPSYASLSSKVVGQSNAGIPQGRAGFRTIYLIQHVEISGKVYRIPYTLYL